MRWTIPFALLGLFAAWGCRSTEGGAAESEDEEDRYAAMRELAGGAPPPLAIPAEAWLNADRAPSLEALRGRVVWLEFAFST